MENTNQKKMSKSVLIGIIGGTVVIIGVAIALFVSYASGASARQVAKQLSMGNRYLNEMSYEDAIVQYQGVLEIEPRNIDALLGIMDAAFATNDNELMKNAVISACNAANEDQELYAANKELMSKIYSSAYTCFDNDDEYASFIDDVYAQTGDESLIALKQMVYEKNGNKLWAVGDYEAALEQLKAAHEADPNNERISEQLQNLLQEYVRICNQQQNYEKALSLLGEYQNILGENTVYTQLSTEVTSAQENDRKMQGLVEALDASFEGDKLGDVLTLMISEEWKNTADKASRVFYSSNILASGDLSGTGTAIYKSEGIIYVYHGGFEKGKRSGKGKWYFKDSPTSLFKYDLTWENDMPNGPGSYDLTSLATRDSGGTTIWFEHAEFMVVNAAYDGQMTITVTVGGISMSAVATYDNGYVIPLSPDQYPAEWGVKLKYFSAETTQFIYGRYFPGRETIYGVDPAPDSCELGDTVLSFS